MLTLVFTRSSTWTIIISFTHKWPSKISFIRCKTICRWLSTIQSNQISPRPNNVPKQPRWDTYMGWQRGMTINASTYQIKRIHRSIKSLERFYRLNMQVLVTSYKTKYLGVMITDNVNWNPHINSKAAWFVKQDYSKYNSVTRMKHELGWKKLQDRI